LLLSDKAVAAADMGLHLDKSSCCTLLLGKGFTRRMHSLSARTSAGGLNSPERRRWKSFIVSLSPAARTREQGKVTKNAIQATRVQNFSQRAAH
jgi:hypothetical protein